MVDDDSDHFHSADEGGPMPEISVQIPEVIQCTNVPTRSCEPPAPIADSKELPIQKPKKKVKKRKNTATAKKPSKEAALKEAVKGNSHSPELAVSVDRVGIQPISVDTVAPGSSEPNRLAQTSSQYTEGTTDEPSRKSLAARKIVDELGDGRSLVPDTIARPLHSLDPVDPGINDDSFAARRKLRIEEEKVERKVIAQAWSDVWNAAWGANDGWEVDDNPLEELSPEKADAKQESCPITREMDDLSVNDAGSRATSFNMWDWSKVSTFAQQLTSSLHTTGVQLVQEGVGVLETLGKKTMSVIEENDPGFYHTKKLLRPPGITEHPTLSEVIREVHNKQDQGNAANSMKDSGKITLVSQLESQRGLVHLEAIKLVGEKAETQLHLHLDTSSISVASDTQMEFIWTILQIEPEEEDPGEVESSGSEQSHSGGQLPASLSEEQRQYWRSLQQSLSRLNSVYSGERLLEATTAAWRTLSDETKELSPQALFRLGVCSLADLTSVMLEFLHKTAECVLVQTHDQCADVLCLASEVVRSIRCLMNLSASLCEEYIQLIKLVGKSANQSTSGSLPSTHSYSQLVASLLLESSNAQSYLREAAQLLVPVFQLAYVESCDLRDDQS